MGSYISKEKEIDSKIPEYAKGFSNDLKYCIMRLLEEYTYNFTYGIKGLEAGAEIFAPDSILEELKEKLPYEYTKEERYIANKKKRSFQDISRLKKYIWELDREQCKEFFRISEDVGARLDRVWIHNTRQIGMSYELSEEEVENCYYAGDGVQQMQKMKEIMETFQKEKMALDVMTKRISVLFGSYGTNKMHNLRLIYYKNARPHSQSGILKMLFSYYTYDNSVLVHETIDIFKSNKSKRKCKEITGKQPKKRKVAKIIDPAWEESKRITIENNDRILARIAQDYEKNGRLKRSYYEEHYEAFLIERNKAIAEEEIRLALENEEDELIKFCSN